jgi:hypothetical protein
MCKDFILLFEFYKVGSDTGIGNSSSTLQRNNTEWTQKHLIMHQIACGLSYHASSMHGIGLSVIMPMTFGVYDIINNNSLHPVFKSADSDIEWTQKSPVLHQIACRLSYFTLYMNKLGIY